MPSVRYDFLTHRQDVKLYAWYTKNNNMTIQNKQYICWITHFVFIFFKEEIFTQENHEKRIFEKLNDLQL